MKRLFALLLICAMAFSLTACGHEHTWVEATCTEAKACSECGATEGEPLGHTWVDATCAAPKTCSVCGTTEGEPLSHTWIDATCTNPKTCSVCGATEGEALGHTVSDWEIVTDASCSANGIEAGVCAVCGETVQRETDRLEHTPGDWETITQPTKDSDGVRVIKCRVCGEELERESFSLSPEELKKLYIDECQSISYDSLARTPGNYEGEKVKFSGYVVQVCSEATSPLYYSTYRVATSGRYDNVVYVMVDNYGTGTRILEDDHITFYGTFDGLYTYTTVRGNSLTIPKVIAEYVD